MTLGHDNESLLFSYMDEFLFIFSTEFFVCKEVEITEFDLENFKIHAIGYVNLYFKSGCYNIATESPIQSCMTNFLMEFRRGEKFDKKKHSQGTEIKVVIDIQFVKLT
jgi:hypothetical protein